MPKTTEEGNVLVPKDPEENCLKYKKFKNRDKESKFMYFLKFHCITKTNILIVYNYPRVFNTYLHVNKTHPCIAYYVMQEAHRMSSVIVVCPDH